MTEIDERQQKRAANIVWNCAGRYDFRPDFRAYDVRGRADLYWNCIFGAARSFIVKMGNSLAIMIVPSLVVAGAAAGENVGVFGLKLTAVAGSVFCILAIFAFLRYNEREVLATIAAGSKEGE